jgi:hypothetical protein
MVVNALLVTRAGAEAREPGLLLLGALIGLASAGLVIAAEQRRRALLLRGSRRSPRRAVFAVTAGVILVALAALWAITR